MGVRVLVWLGVGLAVGLMVVLMAVGPVWGDEADAAKPSEATGGNGGGKLLNRIDFGNAYIMGQTIKSGAVYLLHRKKSDIKSMLKPRADYRREIMAECSLLPSERQQE